MSTREAFEMWFKTENGFHTDTDLLKHDDKYVYAPAKLAWNVWQACQSHNDTVIAELVEALERAIGRIEDMLMADDGQAWKETERALPVLKVRIFDQRIVDIGVIAMTPITTPQPDRVAELEAFAKACQAQEGEAVGKLICDPMGLPALHIPLVDWYVDLGTLEIDTLFYTNPPSSQARISELEATKKKLLDALKGMVKDLEFDEVKHDIQN